MFQKEEANRLEEERKKAEKDREIEEQRRKQREVSIFFLAKHRCYFFIKMVLIAVKEME